MGSSCIYPNFAPQPLKEEYLLTDSLEPTNEWYAIAKITGVKACQSIRKQFGKDYVSLMPTNLYGYNDNFDLTSSHVLPAMIRKFHEAKYTGSVTLWGDGSAMREFLHVDDLAEACFACMKDYDSPEPINVGTGKDISIENLANIIASVVGYDHIINWDTTKPNGTPRKVLNVDKMKSLGWEPNISLEEGIRTTYEWYKENV